MRLWKILALVTRLLMKAHHVLACQSFSRNPAPSVAVCEGDAVSYNCTIADTSLYVETEWSGSAFVCPDNDNAVILIQRAANLGPLANDWDVCGSMMGRTSSISPNCYTSVVTASFISNGSTVQCIKKSSGETVGAHTHIIKRFPTKPALEVTNFTSSTLTIRWNADEVTEAHVLTVDPATAGCERGCLLRSPTDRFVFTGLRSGLVYTIGVRGTNCGGRQEGEASVQQFLIKDVVKSQLTHCLVYEKSSLIVQAIRSSWSPWTPLTLFVGNVTWLNTERFDYRIAFNDSVSSEAFSVSTEQCGAELPCKHAHSFTVGAGQAPSYIVTLSAFGQEVKSVVKLTANDKLVVQAASDQLACTFLPGLIGSSGCRVHYRMQSNATFRVATSVDRGRSGQSVMVPLDWEDSTFRPGDAYVYEASLDNHDDQSKCVLVTGMFQKPFCCNEEKLISINSVENDARCRSAERDLEIEGGRVWYNGTFPGSRARYRCFIGRTLVEGDEERVCHPIGEWSGKLPRCLAANSSIATQNVLVSVTSDFSRLDAIETVMTETRSSDNRFLVPLLSSGCVVTFVMFLCLAQALLLCRSCKQKAQEEARRPPEEHIAMQRNETYAVVN